MEIAKRTHPVTQIPQELGSLCPYLPTLRFTRLNKLLHLSITHSSGVLGWKLGLETSNLIHPSSSIERETAPGR